jgi:hypothetical protein
MNKELTVFVERLGRIFPYLKMKHHNEEDSYNMEADYAIPVETDWFDIIETLKENGLEITNIKQK